MEKLSYSGEVTVYLLLHKRSKKVNPHLYWVMYRNIYGIYWFTKILEKVGTTKKYTFVEPQETLTTESTLDNMMKGPSDINYLQLQPY